MELFVCELKGYVISLMSPDCLVSDPAKHVEFKLHGKS